MVMYYVLQRINCRHRRQRRQRPRPRPRQRQRQSPLSPAELLYSVALFSSLLFVMYPVISLFLTNENNYVPVVPINPNSNSNNTKNTNNGFVSAFLATRNLKGPPLSPSSAPSADLFNFNSTTSGSISTSTSLINDDDDETTITTNLFVSPYYLQHYTTNNNDDGNSGTMNNVTTYTYTIRDCYYDELQQVVQLATDTFFYDVIQTFMYPIRQLIYSNMLADFEQIYRCIYVYGNTNHQEECRIKEAVAAATRSRVRALRLSLYTTNRAVERMKKNSRQQQQQSTEKRCARMLVVEAQPIITTSTTSTTTINKNNKRNKDNYNNKTRIVGFCIVDGKPQLNESIRKLFKLNKPYIHSVMVHRYHRRQGLAFKLMTECETFIIENYHHLFPTIENDKDEEEISYSTNNKKNNTTTISHSTNVNANTNNGAGVDACAGVHRGEIWIHVESNNNAAIALYMNRCGYKKVDSAIDEKSGAIGKIYTNPNYDATSQPKMWTLRKVLP